MLELILKIDVSAKLDQILYSFKLKKSGIELEQSPEQIVPAFSAQGCLLLKQPNLKTFIRTTCPSDAAKCSGVRLSESDRFTLSAWLKKHQIIHRETRYSEFLSYLQRFFQSREISPCCSIQYHIYLITLPPFFKDFDPLVQLVTP